MTDLETLSRRVARIERQVAAIRSTLKEAEEGAVPRVPATPVPAAPAPRTAPVQPPERAPAPPQRARHRDVEEVDLVGTWFARLGAVAVLLGAAFGFKYAVDRGWIGPTGRVVVGLVAGIAFVVAAERARAKTWPRLAQALAGSGAGLIYLSVWAAFGLYGLISEPVAFVVLAAVSAGAALLALRHDSQVLALLAVGGGFLNPYLTGFDRLEVALLSYVLILDLAVLALAYFRRWRVLDAAALAGTWVVALGTHFDSSAPTFAFATMYFAVFAGRGLLHAVGRGRRTEQLDLLLLGVNASAFFGLGLLELNSDLHGAFAVALGALHLAMSTLVRVRVPVDRILRLGLLGTGVAFLTIAVPIQLDGASVPVTWAVEGAALVAVGRATKLHGSVVSGLSVLAMSVTSSVVVDYGFGTEYEPERLLFSIEALTLVVQIAALGFAAAILLRARDVPWMRQAGQLASVAANLLGVAWLTFEAMAWFGQPSAEKNPNRYPRLQFTETAIWAFYATALLSVGIAARLRGARLLAVGLFGVTLLKLCAIDLWLLEPAHRTIAFIGLGLLLLLGSLMYHRFRDLILEGVEPA